MSRSHHHRNLVIVGYIVYNNIQVLCSTCLWLCSPFCSGKDAYLDENAKSAVPFCELKDLQKFFLALDSKEAIDKEILRLTEVVKDCKTVIAALRRSVKDVNQMKVSVAKAKQRFEDSMQKVANPSHGGLAGRVNIQVSEKDPEILRGYKFFGCSAVSGRAKSFEVDMFKDSRTILNSPNATKSHSHVMVRHFEGLSSPLVPPTCSHRRRGPRIFQEKRPMLIITSEDDKEMDCRRPFILRKGRTMFLFIC